MKTQTSKPSRTRSVLGIDVPEALLHQWRAWLMPPVQPYRVPSALAKERGWPDDRTTLTMELLDSFELYGVAPTESVVWLDRTAAATLPFEVRRHQPTAHRWPTADVEADLNRVIRRVERRRHASRHREFSNTAEQRSILPGVQTIAGTFAERSGPNCFAAVMAAAGVAGAAQQWMQLAPFESWLSAATTPGGDDGDCGTVLVWRDTDGAPAHAAVCLGEGLLLHKPSQGWMSPRTVLSVSQGKYSARAPGLRLTRRHLD